MTVSELVDNILSPTRFYVNKKSDAWIGLVAATQFISDDSTPKDRALHYKLNLTERAMCRCCGKVPVNLVINTKGNIVAKCCSAECRNKDLAATLSTVDPETGMSRAQTKALKTKATLLAVDPETGMSRAQEIGLKSKATLLAVDPKTGMSRAQEIGQKTKATLLAVDPETGMSRAQEIGQKTKVALAKIDPKTGMTIAQIRGSALKHTLSAIDPETGLTGYQLNGLKIKQTLSKIDPETGLTGYQLNGQKTKATLLAVDPETGMSRAQEIGLKVKQTLLAVDPETGMSRAQEIGQKANTTKSKVDPETGLSIYGAIGQKTKHIRSQIDPETGLTSYQEAGQRGAETRAKIDPETGLSVHGLSCIKTTKTMSQVDPESGLTGYQAKANNLRSKTYDKILDSTDKFEILTSREQFSSKRYIDITYKCNNCGAVRTTAYQYIRCLECNPYTVSIPEKEVFEFCNIFDTELATSDRKVIKPLEVDIYSEKYKLAIEFDGVYWHSSDSVINEKKDYHLEKTEKCTAQGVQLLHIFENEWKIPEKQLIWKSIIRNKFGESNRIFARKCVIQEVNSKTTKMFLENNHLQGSCPSSINYGLYYNDELVSLLTFGKSRYNKKYKYELLRFCNILNTSITGGASRLFKHFSKNHKGSVISYADKRRSNGNLYKQLGFELSHETEPNYFYIDPRDFNILHSRVKFQKHKLPELLEIFDKSKTESENMYVNGYRKIYDCGNYVFVYDKQ